MEKRAYLKLIAIFLSSLVALLSIKMKKMFYSPCRLFLLGWLLLNIAALPLATAYNLNSNTNTVYTKQINNVEVEFSGWAKISAISDFSGLRTTTLPLNASVLSFDSHSGHFSPDSKILLQTLHALSFGILIIPYKFIYSLS